MRGSNYIQNRHLHNPARGRPSALATFAVSRILVQANQFASQMVSLPDITVERRKDSDEH